jgi:hypothetical protein
MRISVSAQLENPPNETKNPTARGRGPLLYLPDPLPLTKGLAEFCLSDAKPQFSRLALLGSLKGLDPSEFFQSAL